MKHDITKVMAAEIRYQKAKAIFKYAVETKQFLSYIPLAKAIGMFSGSQAFNELIGDIMEEDHENGAPLQCAVLVGAKDLPGHGFFAKARTLGYQFTSDDAFHRSQLKLLGLV